ncbi:MAG: NAD(P)/FAD-dependent oxidoreductase [Planctomycetota bacterium]
MTHVVIIGNGIAGITAARTLRQLEPDTSITVVSGESTHHYSRPALMYIYMGHMRYQDTKPYEDDLWRRERIDLVRDWVTEVKPDESAITLHRGGHVTYDKLLIATGSKSNKFGWPGQDLPGVHGMWDLMDLNAIYETSKRTRHAVVVGGGLIGIELGEMLHSRNMHVTFLVRESSYWNNVLPPEESAMVTRLIHEEGFDLQLETELKEIIAGPDGNVAKIITNHGDEIECELVGLTAGVSPNIDLVKDSTIDTGRGILVDWSLRTNHTNIYAAGDCAEIVTDGDARNVIQQVWYTGKMQGEAVARAMAGEDVHYDPGIWYNSAKFLDLEYQTYGMIMPNPRDGERWMWWEHPNGKHGMRIVYRDDTKTFIGTNVMGIRYRHEVCESWIRDERNVDYVLDHLHEANFDTEFFRRHERDIVQSFRSQLA